MGIIWVGMDAHKKAINVAALFPDERDAHEWALENKPAAIRRLVKKLVREADGREVRCCYEAGPCGYALQRQIEAAGPVICEVIAPALIPRKPGDRVKTDRRDAMKLARLAEVSEAVGATRSRLAKVALLSACLRELCLLYTSDAADE